MLFDGQPTVSPDGSTLLWARGGTLWAAHGDGAEPEQWTRLPAANPDYSPDGRTIVFTAVRPAGTDSDVYEMSAEPKSASNPAVNLTDGLVSSNGLTGETCVMHADGIDVTNIGDNDSQGVAERRPSTGAAQHAPA